MNGLSGTIQKPDLLLCEEGVIAKRVTQQEKFDMQTDIYSVGEVKKKYSEEYKKDSYVELAGKAAFLLEAQDGHSRYSTLRHGDHSYTLRPGGIHLYISS